MDSVFFELITVAVLLGVQHAGEDSAGPASDEDTSAGARGADAPSSEDPFERALDRAKSRVLVNLLNDLRTPLMMIRSPLESGEDITQDAADKALAHTDQIQRGIERAIKIIEMDADVDNDDDSGATELVDAVSYFVSSLRPRADRLDVQVVFNSDVRRAAVAMAWPRVELLLESVADYALRGLADGGKLVFSLERTDDDEIELAVRSDGHFEPVEAGPNRLEDVGDPLTLGLLLGKRTLRRHEGRLDFVQVGDGEMACRITLPAVDEPPAEAPETAAGASEGPVDAEGPQTTVLVVDDHAGTRAYLRFALRKYHRILEASDGKEALEVVREEMPDLVISDIMMPVMDGNELCRAIKSDETLNHIPVFLVTANSIRTLKTESLESGADDFLVKPFDVKEAVIRINNEIKMRKDLRSRYSREVVIKPSDITVTPEDEAFINRARDVVEENIANADFSIQDLASEVGLSSRQLQRRLRETVDRSPVEFVRTLRLKRAAQLLGGQYGNVSEVAYAVGFTSLSYFAKCFKEEYGTSPSNYKDEHSDGEEDGE